MTTLFLSQWREARTRFSNQLASVNEVELTKKLGVSPNSAGFLIRHIAEVELLFAKNVFSLPDVHITARTVMEKRDTGVWVNLTELLEIQLYAAQTLEKAIQMQSDGDWANSVTTKEFGTKSKAEALGRIVSHTAYHAGQLSLVLKYGQ